MAREYLETLSSFIEGATSDLKDDIELECKHFFSGASVYANERICISLAPVGLAAKLPDRTTEKLLISKIGIPLRYFPKGPVKKGYVLFPEGLDTNRKTFLIYVKGSIEYVLTLPKSRNKQT
jgi:hypothetical protein